MHASISVIIVLSMLHVCDPLVSLVYCASIVNKTLAHTWITLFGLLTIPISYSPLSSI